jgi:alkylhydroperoxidase/carboxymuconolactone decarboxylase family protein YurZ
VKILSDTEELLEMLQQGQSVLKKHLPEVLKNFQNISHTVLQEGTLSPKVKELIGIAVSVAIHCQP